MFDGGMVALFRKIDSVWTYTNRIVPSDAVPTMGFGSSVATDGVSIIACWQAEGEDIWTIGDNGAQFISLPDFDWSNPDGGSVDDASNWVPSLPSSGDSASISIPAKFEITTSGQLPFSNLGIGPSKPTLNLGGQAHTLEGHVQIGGTPYYTGDVELASGTLTVQGDVSVGLTNRPGALSIMGNASMTALGTFDLHKHSQLHIELSSNENTPLQLQGPVNIQGSLIVSHQEAQFEPSIGESWIVFESLQPLSDENKFAVIVMPGIGNEKYFELQYVPVVTGTQLVATVKSVDNLYDLDGGDTVNVTGLATDVVVADLGSPSGPVDGFDDIVLSINGNPGSVYIFINDGAGGVSSQISYPAGNNPTSIDAGDIDDDGTLDLAVTNGSEDSFFVLLNDGGDASSMSSESPVATGDLPIDVLIVNIDDDDDADIIIACYGEEDILPDGTIPGELRFYTVSPSMRLNIVLAGFIGVEKPGKINPGDVNNDKDFHVSLTLNLAGKAGLARRVLGHRGFDWEIVQEVSVGANPLWIVTGDVDNDGDDDSVVANTGTNTISILLMGSMNLFEDEIVIEVGSQPGSVDLLDYDGDGDLDLAVIASNALNQRTTYIYRNDTSLNPNQNITFALEQTLDEGLDPILLGSGEMDGDAAQDLVSILSTPTFRGLSDSTVAIKSIPSSSPCEGDFNEDGVVDVTDLLHILGNWGTPEGDINGDGETNVSDVLALIALWGSCP